MTARLKRVTHGPGLAGIISRTKPGGVKVGVLSGTGTHTGVNKTERARRYFQFLNMQRSRPKRRTKITRRTRARSSIPRRVKRDPLVAEVMWWLEFGTKRNGRQHTPPRPIFRLTLRKRRKEHKRVVGRLLSLMMKGDMDVNRALATLGMKVQSDIQTTFEQLRTPPNAPSTRFLKRSGNPGIDTGMTKNHIAWKRV